MTEQRNMIIICLPLALCPQKPDDQVDPVVEDCPECSQPMWVSARKRKLRDLGVRCACMVCLAPEIMASKQEDYIDLASTQN